MPEYLAPGVYVEETSYRAKSIEGVSTSTAGFVGATRSGPESGKPEVLTSFADFQRIYGGLEPMNGHPNYLAFGARAFFDEGGARLYVVRVVGPGALASTVATGNLRVTARDRGRAGNMLVSFALAVGNNVLVDTTSGLALTRVRNLDSVVVLVAGSYSVATAARSLSGVWSLEPATGPALALADVDAVYPLAVTVDVARPTVDARGLDTFTPPVTYGPFSLSPNAPDGLWKVFAATPASSEPPPLVLSPVAGTPTIDTVTGALFPPTSPLTDHWLAPSSLPTAPTAPAPAIVRLLDGNDGIDPTEAEFEGSADLLTGLAALEAIDDISIIAAPGSTELAPTDARAVRQLLVGHCERMRYRAAALDVPEGQSVNGARDWRNETSSTRAAIYYPWVTVADPFGDGVIQLPPSGFAAGIWARNDIRRAVFKSPANEVVLSAVDLERRLTKGQQDVLNPEGVNCLRFFPGKGNVVWGARTIGDDPEWTYLSVRRYFNYVEKSIDRGTQWAVFESNGDALWANVRRTVEDFLVSEWKTGALLGRDPKEAFFVRCDRTTMTQNDLDNGRLVCLVGLAVVKPAEFVIFRIGQWTATAQN
jgi:uncharacterized protein